MTPAESQAVLFAAETVPAAPAGGVSAGQSDLAAYDAALTDDRYGWQADPLPAPQPPACEDAGGR